MQAAFSVRAVDTDKLLYCVKADMDGEGCYYDTYITFDNKTLYLLSGYDRLVKNKKTFDTQFDFKDFISIGWFTAVSLIITFCIIDMFDTIGTLVGTASRAGMVDKEGNMPNMKEALISDSVATMVGAVTGTSTVTTFVESASGVEAGGRTGLTAFTTGILFLACIFIAPFAAIIPAAATSSALIYVGILMLGGLKKVDFEDLSQVAPVALMLIAMPISGSIGHGIGLGLITYTVLKVFTGKAKEVSILTYAISLLFLVKFFLVV